MNLRLLVAKRVRVRIELFQVAVRPTKMVRQFVDHRLAYFDPQSSRIGKLLLVRVPEYPEPMRQVVYVDVIAREHTRKCHRFEQSKQRIAFENLLFAESCLA